MFGEVSPALNLFALSAGVMRVRAAIAPQALHSLRELEPSTV